MDMYSEMSQESGMIFGEGGKSPLKRFLKNYGYLGSLVTPPALGAGELVGSNPAYPTNTL